MGSGSSFRQLSTPLVTRFHPGRNGVKVRLSVDERQNLGRPIVRDFDLPYSVIDSVPCYDPQAMRRGVILRFDQHVERFHRRYPRDRLTYGFSNGNLGANRGFCAFLAAGCPTDLQMSPTGFNKESVLFRLADEPVFENSHYSALVCDTDERVTIEDVFFGHNGSPLVMRKTAQGSEEITDRVRWLSTAQRLIRAGQPVLLDHVVEQWNDLRHLVAPLRLALPDGLTVYVGNAQLKNGLLRLGLQKPIAFALEAQIDSTTVIPLTLHGWLEFYHDRSRSAAFDKAIGFLQQHGVTEHVPSPKDLEQVVNIAKNLEDRFNEALGQSGYRVLNVGRALQEGEARLINGKTLEIFLRKAYYPHSLWATFTDGSVAFIVYPGKSGSVGTSLQDAQRFLLEELQDVEDAVLCDNGGDCMAWTDGGFAVASAEGRQEIRSIFGVLVPRATQFHKLLTLSCKANG